MQSSESDNGDNIRKKVLLVSWSHVDLAFKSMLEDNLEDDLTFYRFSHHESWNSAERSYLKNISHIFSQIKDVWGLSRGKEVVLFGTNLCRIFFPLIYSGVHYVYNELPSVRFGLLGLYDRLVFLLSKHVYVSSSSRADLLSKRWFNSERLGVLENTTFSNIDFYDGSDSRINKAIFIGAVANRRFGPLAQLQLEEMINSGIGVDILPSFIKYGFNFSNPKVKILDGVPHHLVNSIISQYKFGILAYEPVSLNNYYAAPLKIYEYVNAGLRVISLLENEGIDSIRKKYPALFFDPKNPVYYVDEEYQSMRKQFLMAAIDSNQLFVDKVLC